MIITRVEPMSIAKMFAILYGIFALLFALPMGCFASLMGSAMSDVPGAGNAFGGIGIMSIITFPLMGAIGGFIIGLIYGFLYNLVAGWVGGIEVEVDSEMGGSIL